MFIKKTDSADISSSKGETVVTNVTTGESVSINEMGAFFLSFLKGEAKSVEDIVSQIKETFPNVPYEELYEDFTAYMGQLAECDLVKFGASVEELDFVPLKCLHVELTMKCNERCIHCYLPNQTKNEGATLSFADFCKIVDDFVALGGEDIELSGGEPMKHPNFLAMVKYCSEKGLNVFIISNLTLLDDDMIAKFKAYNVSGFQVSIYSLDSEVHDGITKYRGSLSKSISALEKLRSNGFSVIVACPIMEQNANHLISLYEYCKTNDIPLRSNTAIMEQTDGNTDFIDSSRLLQEEKRALYCTLISEMPDFCSNFLTFNPVSGNLKKYPEWFSRQTICSAGVEFCSISPDGDVYPCPEWKAFKLGNVKKASLSEVWKHSEKLKELRKFNKRSNFPKCLSCQAIDYCKVCLNLNMTETGGEANQLSQSFCDEAFLMKELYEKNCL